MTWVLLRGLAREARHWNTFAARFSKDHADQAIITLDLPGNGAFFAETSPICTSAMVDFARQQLRLKGVLPPYQFLALSLGGMVATRWAQLYPQEVVRMVLINTSMRPFSRLTQRLRPGNWLKLALVAARWRDAQYVEQVIHQLTCHETASRAGDVAQWLTFRQDAPISAANTARQLLAAARFSGGSNGPACPALILSCVTDRLVNAQCSTRLALAWQAEHHQHPWAGHDLPHDDADWVCQRIAAWIQTQ